MKSKNRHLRSQERDFFPERAHVFPQSTAILKRTVLVKAHSEDVHKFWTRYSRENKLSVKVLFKKTNNMLPSIVPLVFISSATRSLSVLPSSMFLASQRPHENLYNYKIRSAIIRFCVTYHPFSNPLSLTISPCYNILLQKRPYSSVGSCIGLFYTPATQITGVKLCEY